MTDHQFYIDAGRRLRELRERGLNETPAQFAKRFGLSVRDYLAYEEGRRSRGWDRHLHAIADMGVSFDWLFDTGAARVMFRADHLTDTDHPARRAIGGRGSPSGNPDPP